jgi:hypothetical protein
MTDTIPKHIVDRVLSKAARLSVKQKETNDCLTIEELTEAAKIANIQPEFIRQAFLEIEEEKNNILLAKKKENIAVWNIWSGFCKLAIVMFGLFLLRQTLVSIISYQPDFAKALIEASSETETYLIVTLGIGLFYPIIKAFGALLSLGTIMYIVRGLFFVIDQVVDLFGCTLGSRSH